MRKGHLILHLITQLLILSNLGNCEFKYREHYQWRREGVSDMIQPYGQKKNVFIYNFTSIKFWKISLRSQLISWRRRKRKSASAVPSFFFLSSQKNWKGLNPIQSKFRVPPRQSIITGRDCFVPICPFSIIYLELLVMTHKVLPEVERDRWCISGPPSTPLLVGVLCVCRPCPFNHRNYAFLAAASAAAK